MLSTSAFKFNLRRYSEVGRLRGGGGGGGARVDTVRSCPSEVRQWLVGAALGRLLTSHSLGDVRKTAVGPGTGD